MQLMIAHRDREFVEDLKYSLETDGMIVYEASTIACAHELLTKQEFQFCLVGSQLEDGNALDFRRRMEDDVFVPMIVVSEHSTSTEAVLCLEYGYDDYMRFPIDFLELKSRIRCVLRRWKTRKDTGKKNAVMEIGQIEADFIHHTLSYQQNQIELTMREFEVFYHLWTAEGAVVSRTQLLTKLGGETDSQSRTADVYVRRIRTKCSKLGFPNLIRTVWGRGYRFQKELL